MAAGSRSLLEKLVVLTLRLRLVYSSKIAQPYVDLVRFAAVLFVLVLFKDAAAGGNLRYNRCEVIQRSCGT